MSESVLIAIITGILAVLGSYVGNVSISRKKAVRTLYERQRGNNNRKTN